MPTSGGLRLVAFVAVCTACGAAPALAQTAPSSSNAPPLAQPAAAGADDIAMPDDLGAPLAGAASAPAPSDAVAGARSLTVDTPIARIAANPQGKAALERALPGLCERAEYPMFKSMTLRQLAGMSNGRITEAKLDTVQADLTHVAPVEGPIAPSHGMFYPLTHTASYTVRYGGRQIRQLSHSLYHRVALVVASL